MRIRRRPVAAIALGAMLCLAVNAGLAEAATVVDRPGHAAPAGDTAPTGGPAPAPGTTPVRDLALAAMRGEAFARAKYLAFASQARRSGQPALARLFTSTARAELGEHFTETARLIGFAGDNRQNLREAIAGETYESTIMYPGFASQATADGCAAAAELFAEIARDERGHAGLFRRALAALTRPGPEAVIPLGERVDAVPIPKRMPACSGRTQANLLAAMQGEALAAAKYRLYATRAQNSGVPRLATLFRNTARAELVEHFAEEATLAGLVGSDRANIRDSIDGTLEEATDTYPSFARQAFRQGHGAAATLFMEIADDEMEHARAFQAAQRRLRGENGAGRARRLERVR